MKIFTFFRDMSLRLKVGILLIAASTLPLAIMALIDITNEKQLITKDTTNLLIARGDQVAGELDGFNRNYMGMATRLAQLPEIIKGSRALFDATQKSDEAIRGIGFIDSSGTVVTGTEKALVGRRLAFYRYIQDVLRGSAVISDVHVAASEAGPAPTIAYAAPIKTPSGNIQGAVVLWVRAASMWKILETWNAAAGEGSFSVLFDQYGVRIGHSYSKDIVFHPGGALDRQTIDAMAAENRFGERTRELLEAPKDFPDQFEVARAPSPGVELFRGFAPANKMWNYGVPRRLGTVHWTLFYMIPEASLAAPVKDMVRRAILVSLAIILVALGFGMLFADKTLGKPIREITAVAERIALGDVDVVVASGHRGDEVGRLAQSFKRMTEYLQAMTSVARRISTGDLTASVRPQSEKDVLGNAFLSMTEGLQGMTRELTEGITVLGSSASEILAATTQVAAGATESATAVSETTATVEEVKQTARLSTDKARSVSESAQKAALVAQQGDAAVTETVEGINHIRGLMASVAEGIVKLSEQTQAIGEIITAVNDLAQQSNLLSVNAAIEASKAGEQGKGFTVVAQEIKSLADQSKQATEQVRTILTDIQKATSAAVMAAEQVSKAVDAGAKQSNESGESIKRLAETISEAAQAATQIAASSQQQLVGMEQVALAMENIKQSAQQNVAGTQQAEQAAHNLNELGRNLKKMVERYTVEAGGAEQKTERAPRPGSRGETAAVAPRGALRGRGGQKGVSEEKEAA